MAKEDLAAKRIVTATDLRKESELHNVADGIEEVNILRGNGSAVVAWDKRQLLTPNRAPKVAGAVRARNQLQAPASRGRLEKATIRRKGNVLVVTVAGSPLPPGARRNLVTATATLREIRARRALDHGWLILPFCPYLRTLRSSSTQHSPPFQQAYRP